MIIKTTHRYTKSAIRHWRQFLIKRLVKFCGSDLKIFGRTHIDLPSLVTIGNNVSLNENVMIAARYDEITIGDNVVISSGALVTSAGYNYMGTAPHPNHDSKPVTIENNAWIGANAVILPGVTIGKHAVIAAGAVVTKNVPPNTMVAGVPAKAIKTLPERP